MSNEMKRMNEYAKVKHFMFLIFLIISIVLCALYQLKIEGLAITKDEIYEGNNINEILENGVNENVIKEISENDLSNDTNEEITDEQFENSEQLNDDLNSSSLDQSTDIKEESIISNTDEIIIKKAKKVEEYDQITVVYNIDISQEATGLGSDFLYDGIVVPTIHNSNKYAIKVDNSNSLTVEDISSKFVTPYDSETTYDTKDRKVLEFSGWKVGNTSDVIKVGTTISWNQLSTYAVDGVVNLNTAWNCKENYQYVNFYLNYCSVALDISGNITERDQNAFTPSLWASAIGNPTTSFQNIADETADNSYTANNKIRNLEGDKSDGSLFIYQFPTDEYIFEQLKQYSANISIDGESISVEKLDTDHFEVRWYVFKLQNDCWHIDGKLVRKEGKIIINKEFKGSKIALEMATGYSFDLEELSNTDYYIEVKTANSNNKLLLQDAEIKKDIISITKEDGSIEDLYVLKFKWIMDVKYGIKYSISEKQYWVQNHNTETIYKITDPNETKYKKNYNPDGSYELAQDENGNNVIVYNNQSTSEVSGDSVDVIGINNYALDHQEIKDFINVDFVNIYTLKQDDGTNFKMPETGGKGRKIFYIIGAGLIMVQTIIFIIKKKGRIYEI